MSEIQGKVIRVLSPNELVINIGSSQGVTDASRFLVYALGEDVKDPETKESLGQLEIVKGRAEAKHVQPKMSTIRSAERKRELRDRHRPIVDAHLPSSIIGWPRFETLTEEVEVTVPFEGAKEGDLVRVL